MSPLSEFSGGKFQIAMAVIKGKLLGPLPLRASGGSASILQAKQAPVRTE